MKRRHCTTAHCTTAKKLNIAYGALLVTINLGEWHYQKKEYAEALECLKAAEKAN